MQAKESL